MTEIESIRAAILEGADGETVGALPLPESFRAAVVRADEQEMFAGLPSEAKDPRKSTHVEDVALPELAPDEAYVAVMASAINFKTVWTSIFEPLPTFQFLKRLGNQRIWGFESNYGGLAEIALAKANQLMPKPAHLTWEEAACNALCNSTSYRMIVSPNGAQMTQGQTVLVWGASGGIGAYAAQYVLNGGGTPVGVVSSPERAELLHEMGVEHVIDRKAEGYQFWKDEHTQDPGEWRRLGKKIRDLTGADPDIVFEHPGRQTMGASVFVCKRGGMIITCAATSGYTIEYDNRYLWMMLKTLKGSHFANYREAWDANRLVGEGKIHPTLSVVYPLDQTGEAAAQVHGNLVEGKVGVLCLAPEEGLGVTNPALREEHLDQITLFRRHHKV